MESVGEFLSRERKSKNVTVEEVSAATKIQPKYIRALEEDNFTLLPPEVIIKGFIEAYARCLGLDPKEMLLLYKEQVIKRGKQKSLVNPLKENTLFPVEIFLRSRRRTSLGRFLLGLFVFF